MPPGSGVFDGISTDPRQTLFARWKRTFTAADPVLEEKLQAYGAAEAAMLTYAGENVVGNPDKAESYLVRLKTRRLTKVDRSLLDAATYAEEGLSQAVAINSETVSDLRDALHDLVFKINDLQQTASEGMTTKLNQVTERAWITMGVMAAVFAAGFAVAFVSAQVTTRRIGTPLRQLSGTIEALAERNFNTIVPFKDRKDEIGAIAMAAEVFRESGIERRRLEREREETRAREERERLERIEAEHAR